MNRRIAQPRVDRALRLSRDVNASLDNFTGVKMSAEFHPRNSPACNSRACAPRMRGRRFEGTKGAIDAIETIGWTTREWKLATDRSRQRVPGVVEARRAFLIKFFLPAKISNIVSSLFLAASRACRLFKATRKGKSSTRSARFAWLSEKSCLQFNADV